VRERTLAWLAEQDDWRATSKIAGGVEGQDSLVRESLFDLFETGQVALSVGVAGKPVQPVGADEDADYRREGLRRYWKAHKQRESESASHAAPTHANNSAAPPEDSQSAQSASPRRGNHWHADSLTGQIPKPPASSERRREQPACPA
jgi:hypothetical protein